MRESIVTEYVELSARLASLATDADVEAEERLYTRLDRLWYAEMTDNERREAERRLEALGASDRAWHDARRMEDS